jgi:Udp N-acetylglucosamine O-acyltransferase
VLPKEAYRLLLRRGLLLEDALAKMAALQDPLVDEMVAFVHESKRGFGHAARDADD